MFSLFIDILCSLKTWSRAIEGVGFNETIFSYDFRKEFF